MKLRDESYLLLIFTSNEFTENLQREGKAHKFPSLNAQNRLAPKCNKKCPTIRTCALNTK